VPLILTMLAMSCAQTMLMLRPALLLALLVCGSALAGCSLLVDTSPGSSWHASYMDAILAAEDARDATSPVLLRGMVEDEPTIRRASIRALGRIRDPESVGPLFAVIAREDDLDNRLEGLFALGLIGHPAATGAIEEFVRDPNPATRAMAVRALGMTRDERTLLTLLTMFEDESPAVRSESGLAVARMIENRSDRTMGRSVSRFLPAAEAMRQDPDAQVREACAVAVGAIRDPELRPYLLDGLNDEDWRVRMFSCVGLAALPARASDRELVIEMTRDESWQVVVEAARVLGNDVCTESFTRLASLAANPANGGHELHQVRAAAAQALSGFSGVPGASEVLVAALNDPSEVVRGAALESLATVEDPGAGEALFEDVLFGRSPAAPTAFLRARVARAAGRLPDERGYRLVNILLRDPDVPVRTAALAELASFPGRRDESRNALQAGLKEREVALREAAASAAATLMLQELWPVMEWSLEDSRGVDFVETRLALLKAMAKLGGRDSLPALRRSLTDPERIVRMTARTEIAGLGGAIPNLPPMDAPLRRIVPQEGVDFLTSRPPARVRIVTARGDFVLELYEDEAPTHAKAFLGRCRRGEYDGLPFHRVVPGFVVQGLDPRGDGYGTGGVSIRDEVNQLRYLRGTVGMPNAGPDTGGCQMFVTFGPHPRLDARYTVFAQVIDGMEVVDRLDVGDEVVATEVLSVDSAALVGARED